MKKELFKGRVAFLLSVLMITLILGCGINADTVSLMVNNDPETETVAEPTPVPAETANPEPTSTPRPTFAYKPTATPAVIEVPVTQPQATATPVPTSTPAPTEIPVTVPETEAPAETEPAPSETAPAETELAAPAETEAPPAETQAPARATPTPAKKATSTPTPTPKATSTPTPTPTKKATATPTPEPTEEPEETEVTTEATTEATTVAAGTADKKDDTDETEPSEETKASEEATPKPKKTVTPYDASKAKKKFNNIPKASEVVKAIIFIIVFAIAARLVLLKLQGVYTEDLLEEFLPEKIRPDFLKKKPNNDTNAVNGFLQKSNLRSIRPLYSNTNDDANKNKGINKMPEKPIESLDDEPADGDKDDKKD